MFKEGQKVIYMNERLPCYFVCANGGLFHDDALIERSCGWTKPQASYTSNSLLKDYKPRAYDRYWHTEMSSLRAAEVSKKEYNQLCLKQDKK